MYGQRETLSFLKTEQFPREDQLDLIDADDPGTLIRVNLKLESQVFLGGIQMIYDSGIKQSPFI